VKILKLIPYIYKCHPAYRATLNGWKGWRLRWYGVILLSRCECDNVQGCWVYTGRSGMRAGAQRWWDEETQTHEEYDPRDDCECYTRAPHRHSRIGFLSDSPIGGQVS
jgi:hypothetical protein